MTSYFDDLRTEVRTASKLSSTDGEFLAELEELEASAIADINLVTGDREFPDDLRERIQRLIAVGQTRLIEGQPPTRHRIENLMMRRSHLLEELHSAFHEVGSRRIQTRFGILSDHPRVNLSMRDDHDLPDDPSMGPCISCGTSGEDLPVHHTCCECDLEACPKAICDDCRMAGGNWAWIEGEHEDDTREVYIDCYHRMKA